MNEHRAVQITGFCSLIAGFLHMTLVAMQHWTPFPPLESGFFVVIGIVQIILGYQFLKKPSVETYRASLFVNGGIASLYLLLRYIPVPFVGEPEAHELLGITITFIEAIAIATSIRWLLVHAEHGRDRTLPLTASCALIAIILGGLGYYGGAQSMALLMSDRRVEHHHGSHHPHHEGDDHHAESVPHQEEPHDENEIEHHDDNHGH